MLNLHSQTMLDILKLQFMLIGVEPMIFTSNNHDRIKLVKMLPVVGTSTGPITKMMESTSISNNYQPVCDL